MLEEPNYIKLISKKLDLKEIQVQNVLKLLDEDNTIPFIARYRKEVTQNLDEVLIKQIQDLKKREKNLYENKLTALNNINEQKKLTDELKKAISDSDSVSEVMDIYAPFKRKKKTKADIAIEKGFKPISEQILNQESISISNDLLFKYSKEEIILGACDIVVQILVDDAKNKQGLRFYFLKYGEIISKFSTKKKLEELSDKSKNQIHKFEIYSNFQSEVNKLKSYQILALNRGENLGILNIKLEKDDLPLENLKDKYIDKSKANIDILKNCIKDAYKRLFTSIETEVRNELTQKAEIVAIGTFEENLKKLLLIKPQYAKSVLGIDPGFRTGCKLAFIDKDLIPKEFSKIYLNKSNSALLEIKRFIEKYSPDVIAIGNGTASNETFDLIKDEVCLPIYIVNEAGASVYSASEIGMEEFPNLDATDRGTVSIARRFVDPLSELVKINPESIGVGMYQHDVNENKLREKLGFVIEQVVNMVGINLNTSSEYVLRYISGITKRNAKKVFENRPYQSREMLKKVLSAKAFQQASGFLRLPNSSQKLDNTNIHPEQYKLAVFIIENKITPLNYKKEEIKLKKLYPDFTEQTLIDILDSYKNIGIDPRKYEAILKINKTITIDDLKDGDIILGVVRNIMQFGAFVDIGIKNDGLVHISQLADKFVKNPHEIVEIGEEVKVKIIGIDIKTNKVQLSMKDLN